MKYQKELLQIVKDKRKYWLEEFAKSFENCKTTMGKIEQETDEVYVVHFTKRLLKSDMKRWEKFQEYDAIVTYLLNQNMHETDRHKN